MVRTAIGELAELLAISLFLAGVGMFGAAIPFA
jgi:hypothetical protein